MPAVKRGAAWGAAAVLVLATVSPATADVGSGIEHTRLAADPGELGGGADGDSWASYDGLFSGDGRYVLFEQLRFDKNLYLVQRWWVIQDLTDGTRQAYPPPAAVQDGARFPDALANDGRTVLFSTFTSLVDEDKGGSDLYRYDLVSGAATLVSVDETGAPTGLVGEPADVTPDGRYVAFSTITFSDQDGALTLGAAYLRDLVDGVTTRLRVQVGGVEVAAGAPQVSDDGRVVSFLAPSGPHDTRGSVYLWTADGVSRISSPGGTSNDPQGAGQSRISGDGTRVVYDYGGTAHQILAYDRTSGTSAVVSQTYQGTGAELIGVAALEVSADGRYVAFASEHPGLVPGDTNGELDVFRRDLVTGQTERISVLPDGRQPRGASTLYDMADSGAEFVQRVAGAFPAAAGDSLRTRVAPVRVVPDTSITGGTSGLTRSAAPSISFASGGAGMFQCRLDSAAWSACASPHAFTAVPHGRHLLAVRAVSPTGLFDRTPATRTVTVDLVPPSTTLTAGPRQWSTTEDRTPTFRYSSNTAGSRFRCRVDARAWASCGTAAWTTPKLGLGPHKVRIVAVDPAGNPDPTPAVRSFRVAY